VDRTLPTRRGIAALTLAFVVAGSLLIAAGWHVLHRKDQEQLRLETSVTAEQMRFRLESWVKDRTTVLAHVARTRGTAHGPPAHGIDDEVAFFLQEFPDFQAINLVDADGRIIVVAPLETNRTALGKNLFDHPWADVRETLAKARNRRTMVRTRAIDLFQGGWGFAIYEPQVAADGSLSGFINGVFRIGTMVDACLPEPALRERFDFRLREADGTVVYATGEPAASEPLQVERTVMIVDRPWTLQVSPSAAMLAAASSPAYGLVALTCFLLLLTAAFFGYSFLVRKIELAESRARYKILVDNQAEMVIQTDERGRCLYASPSFQRTMGLDVSALPTRDLLTFIHPDDRAECLDAFARIRRPPHAQLVELRTRTAEGWRWFSWSTRAVLGADGRIAYLVAVGRDVSRRRDLEEQLRQSQKMEAVGHLAGGIAHDFNNILQSIMGSLELARMDLDEDHTVTADLDQALASAERAAGLTRQLLAFSRRQVLQPRVLDLNAVVADMRGLLERTMGEHLVLTFDLHPSPCLIYADETQVQQVLLNLCVNARDAVQAAPERGGGVHVRTDTAELDEAFCHAQAWARPGRYAILEVVDEGCGMPPEQQELIFEPFYTTKRESGGTGLGLSTVYGIVEQHQGLLQLESEPGRGTVFRVHFQLETDAAMPEAPRTAEAGGVGCETILLAEDDEGVRAFARRSLERAGYAVLAAADGDEALRLFAQDPDRVDLALLDVVMPGIGGREVHDRLREVRPDLPVLFCSGYSGDSLHTRFILDEGLQLLPKPYERRALLSRIRSLLDAGVGVAG